MSLKGKGKQTVIFILAVTALAILLFVPDREKDAQEEALRIEAKQTAADERMSYIRKRAWYMEKGDTKYWLVFSPEGYPNEGENGTVMSFAEHTQTEMTEDDFNGRFDSFVYYDEIIIDDDVMIFSGADAGKVENRFAIDRKKEQLIFTNADETDSEAIYECCSVNEVMYPVYTYGSYRGMSGN